MTNNLFPKFDIYSAIQEGLKELACQSTDEGKNRLQDITIHTYGYSEPNYSDVDIVACGNWNDISKWTNGKCEIIDKSPSMAADFLEKLCDKHGFSLDLQWSDEWNVCCDCNKLFRISADSYNWSRYYWLDEDAGEYVCGDCVIKNPEDYLLSLEGNHKSCITIELDLEKNGYVKIEDGFEYGFHDGQDASPELIANAMREQGIQRFIFNLDSTGQFDINFSVYIHKSEEDKFNKKNFDEKHKDGPSVSGAIQKALKSANLLCQGIDAKDGVQVIKCNSDGTSTVKIVSQQDFINGKALE